jgi:Mg2+ and Co2+ transporter CorA
MGQIRKQGVDYITYMLLDAVVDRNFLSLESLAEQAE